MAKRSLYLVRHGQYATTSEALAEPDGSLTPVGQEQAALTAQRLRDLPIRAIHYGTLRRTIETAEIIAAHLPGTTLRPSPLLRECIPFIGPPETLPTALAAFFAQLPPDVLAEGAAQAQAAFVAYFTNPGEDDQHDVIVSSGNLINYFVCRVLQAPAAWIYTDIQHCGLSEIVIGEPRGVLLVRHNDTGHLPKHLQTYT